MIPKPLNLTTLVTLPGVVLLLAGGMPTAFAQSKKPPCPPGVISSGCDRNPGGTQLRKAAPAPKATPPAAKPQPIPKGQDLQAKPQPAPPLKKPPVAINTPVVRKPAPTPSAPNKPAAAPVQDKKNPQLEAAAGFMNEMKKRQK